MCDVRQYGISYSGHQMMQFGAVQCWLWKERERWESEEETSEMLGEASASLVLGCTVESVQTWTVIAGNPHDGL